jgi:hypothetical protein
MNFDTTGFMTVVGILAAIAVTVLSYIFIIPEKKRENLPKIFKMIHDLFNFRELFLEKILKALYVLSTAACVTIGLFWQFGFTVWEDWYSGDLNFEWAGGRGLLLIICGPIIVRIAYEIMMMFVLLVKNTIEINNKMKSQEEAPAAPAIEEVTEA